MPPLSIDCLFAEDPRSSMSTAASGDAASGGAAPGVESDPMSLAFELAQHALSLGEVPIACVIVHPTLGTLSTGYNLVNHTRDATRHAELVALDRLFTGGKSSDKLCLGYPEKSPPVHPSQPVYVERSVEECLALVRESTVYVNCEPCIQCAAALREVGCAKVVYGCCNPRFGGNGSLMDLHLADFLPDGNRGYAVEKGVREDEAINVLRMFYDCENMSAPEEKRTKKEGREKRAVYDGGLG